MAGTFANKTLVIEGIGQRPQLIANLMEQHLSQQQLTGLEALLFPALPDARKAELLTEAHRRLSLAGLGSDEIMGDIASRIAELQA